MPEPALVDSSTGSAVLAVEFGPVEPVIEAEFDHLVA